MWLLSTKDQELKYFSSEDVAPPYAILSHTWGEMEDEVAFHELKSEGVEKKPGFAKIRYCCNQALKDGLLWAWIDTYVFNRHSVQILLTGQDVASTSEVVLSFPKQLTQCIAIIRNQGCVSYTCLITLHQGIWMGRP